MPDATPADGLAVGKTISIFTAPGRACVLVANTPVASRGDEVGCKNALTVVMTRAAATNGSSSARYVRVRELKTLCPAARFPF